jgi:hypothetical protein
MIPVAVLRTLADRVGVGSQGTRAHSERSEEHREGDRDDPVVHGIDNKATMELKERSTLDHRTTEFEPDLPKVHQPATDSGL